MNIQADFKSTDDNPFSSPTDSPGVLANQLNGLLWRAVFTIVGAMVLLAILGAGAGWLVGVLAPGYYEAMFSRVAGQPGFQPTQIGLGLGMSQGAGVGFLVGSVAVVSVAWYRSRLLKAT